MAPDRSVIKALVSGVLWVFAVLVQMPAEASDASGQVQQVQTPTPEGDATGTGNKPVQPSVPGCPALPPFRAQILADWDQPAQQIHPLSRSEGEVLVPIGTKFNVTLLPSDDVSLVWQEEEGKRIQFAGLLTFHTGKAGGYRFLTTPYVWLELVPNKIPEQKEYASSTDRRFKCYGIKKNIIFNNLSADTTYWLQVSGSPESEVEMLIAVPEEE